MKQLKRLFKKIVSWIKNLFSKKSEEQKYVYLANKNVYVTFKDGKTKLKLRKYIAQLARALGDVNFLGYDTNRKALINEFELSGVAGINNYYNNQLKEYLKK